MKCHMIVSNGHVMNVYYVETIEQQPKHRRSADLLAAILKVVIMGEETKRGIERGSNMSFSQLKRYLLLSLESGLVMRDQHEESVYRITQKGIRFLHTVEKLNEMIQYPRR